MHESGATGQVFESPDQDRRDMEQFSFTSKYQAQARLPPGRRGSRRPRRPRSGRLTRPPPIGGAPAGVHSGWANMTRGRALAEQRSGPGVSERLLG
jgi:hypothetical protein